ncbi:hypothetical protein MUK60_01935 [Streptomyces sp. LRE541]|nr:hypothetical protein [Streptomyces sp. LRE541]UPZ26678.1 hypothetical protein MUK60_01935 [Streptomyces sp. LRE541]
MQRTTSSGALSEGAHEIFDPYYRYYRGYLAQSRSLQVDRPPPSRR